MSTVEPAVTVVVATRDRSERLKALLDSLRGQSLQEELFDVVVVDDGSTDGTPELLGIERERSELSLRITLRERSGGPGTARNEGWRSGEASLIAFIDDDCIASPGWLQAGLEASRSNPGAIVQGRTEGDPGEEATAGPFSYTIRVPRLGPHYETCNIFYPRAVLERCGGFDTDAFPGGGEDTDLAWRAIESGTPTVFAPEAHVFHAVHRLGPRRHLKRAWHWTDTIRAYARHPGLRKAHLFRGVFWKIEHYALLRVLIASLLLRRLRPLRRWFLWRFTADLLKRARADGHGLLAVPLLPYLVLHDLVELASVVRGAIRYRTLVL